MYNTDRKYTDSKHSIVVQHCYPRSFIPVNLPQSVKTILDNQNAIDYICVSSRTERVYFIQERIRRFSSGNYNDFTIRYKRTKLNDVDEEVAETEWSKLCEFIKGEDMNFWMIYAFVDDDGNVPKYVIADLKKIVELSNEGKMKVIEGYHGCFVKDGVLHVGTGHVNEEARNQVQHFMTIDVPMLMDFCPEAVIYQKNYLVKGD